MEKIHTYNTIARKQGTEYPSTVARRCNIRDNKYRVHAPTLDIEFPHTFPKTFSKRNKQVLEYKTDGESLRCCPLLI